MADEQQSAEVILNLSQEEQDLFRKKVRLHQIRDKLAQDLAGADRDIEFVSTRLKEVQAFLEGAAHGQRAMEQAAKLEEAKKQAQAPQPPQGSQ